jgi:hypothetical protein
MGKLRHKLPAGIWIWITGAVLLLIMLVTDSVIAEDRAALLAQNRVTKFTAIDASCELINEGVTTTNDDTGITHIKGEIYKGITVSDNELFNGTSYIVVDTEMDQETGESKVWVTSIFYPEFVDGSFIAPGQGVVTAEGPSVSHRGHGTGELAGLRIRFDVRAAQEPGTLPCEPLFPPAQLEGVIIDLPTQ